uniref:Peptidase C1A papain C-terminal domain-containing protein n=1 Tax=viral metagenome TaxID=1070528 RepID=A0A6C0KHA4_9ZZZZ
MSNSDRKLREFMKANLQTDHVLKFSKTKMAKLKASSTPGETVSDHTTVGLLGATFSLPDSKKFKVAKKVLRADETLLPESWNNYTLPAPKDDADKAKYYKKVDLSPTKYNISTRPQAQKKCGSCFAFACATAISDAFVFGKNLSYNPLNSPLDIMSCVNDGSNDKCDGGNPLGVLTFLSENNGITSSHCVSYDNWVAGDKLTSDAIPTCAGCYIKQCGDPKPKPNRYQIKAPVFITSSDATSNGDKVDGVGDSAIHDIKLHLLQYGAAITGFAVLNNFLNDPDGSFHETNGVYFENKVYDAGKSDGAAKGAEKKKGDDPFVCAGGHAVCIVGWGVSAKPITVYFPNDTDPAKKSVTLQNCPYWVVRNSWGKDWGDGGYFKMAMYQKVNQDGAEYEINPNVAFERFRSYSAKMMDKDGNVTTQEMPIGGVIMIEPSDIVPDTQEPRDAPPYTNDEMRKFYCSDSELPPSSQPSMKDSSEKSSGSSPPPKSASLSVSHKSNLDKKETNGTNGTNSTNGNNNFLFFIFILACIGGLFYYFKYFKKTRK